MSVRKYHQITLERDGCQYFPRKAIESFGFSLLWLVTGPKSTCHILNQSDMTNLVYYMRIVDSRSLRRVHHFASPTTFHCMPKLASSPLTFVRIDNRFFVHGKWCPTRHWNIVRENYAWKIFMSRPFILHSSQSNDSWQFWSHLYT